MRNNRESGAELKQCEVPVRSSRAFEHLEECSQSLRSFVFRCFYRLGIDLDPQQKSMVDLFSPQEMLFGAIFWLSVTTQLFDNVAFLSEDGVIGRPSLWIAEDFWVLRFRLMVKRGPL